MKSALVTGASSGIGEATAIRLVRAGWKVFAGVRNVERFSNVTPGLVPVALDVSDADSISVAQRTIATALDGKGLDALVNNAGIGQVLPMEYTTAKDLQEIFSVNVFGLLAVTQAFLPLLRKSRGRIVNLSSIGALITIPFGGALCATKHCVEAFSDALRMELLPDGIEVIAIRPASIHSPAADKLAAAEERMIEGLPAEGKVRYAAGLRHFIAEMMKGENSGSAPDVVAEVIETALTAARPHTHYLAGKNRHLLSFLGRWVPDRLRDQLLLRQLGLPHDAEGGE
jgi:NAD(P)-dependent dehydrogenase (short-subunit alcohol dehydrogenase family)